MVANRRKNWMEKNYYTVKEIMAMLGISRPTVYSLLKQNQFRWLMLGGKYRISRKSFDEWLEGRMNTINA